jgi:hypothetical protein
VVGAGVNVYVGVGEGEGVGVGVEVWVSVMLSEISTSLFPFDRHAPVKMSIRSIIEISLEELLVFMCCPCVN